MSPTRRDVLKMAAAVPMLGAALSQRDALAELAKPAALEPVRFEDHDDASFDPASFADAVHRGTLQNVLGGAEINHAAKGLHDYKKLRTALVQAHPEITIDRYDDLFVKLDESVYALWCEAHMEGVRLGAVLENLRIAAIGPLQECARCDGVGLVDQDGQAPHPYKRSESLRTCPHCNGTGTVPADELSGQPARRRAAWNTSPGVRCPRPAWTSYRAVSIAALQPLCIDMIANRSRPCGVWPLGDAADRLKMRRSAVMRTRKPGGKSFSPITALLRNHTRA